MILSYPLVWIQTKLPNPTLKKLFSILCGVSTLQFCCGARLERSLSLTSSWIHSLISSTIVLFIVRFCNPKRQPIYVFVFSLLYLSLRSVRLPAPT